MSDYFIWQSVKGVAKAHEVCTTTLYRYVKKKNEDSAACAPGYGAHNRPFSEDQESGLRDYLLKAEGIYYGLSPHEVSLDNCDS